MLLVHSLRGLICESVTEITIQLLGVSDPASAQHLKSIRLIWVILTKIANVALLLVFAPEMACERVLVLVD